MGRKLRDRRARHDRYYKAARDQDYAARSIFKLQEIDRRCKLLRRKQRVLDLGCRPGSWLQYAAERVGPEGRVVGLDRQPLDIAVPDNAEVHVGDVMTIDPIQLRGEHPCFQVVLSDMAPDTSGVAFADQVRSAALFERALDIALAVGCPGSSFTGKIFMGEGFEPALARVRERYERVRTLRPDATRKRSTEVYVVAQGRRS